ncbi:annexin ANXC4 [Blumeria hordei DH14]|uniref:Annexin ANXC4 n=1 Tax=Blumeria graminis f. sp. hordei (strain DH14) TaxID=546991 RepID=N1JFM6_BLUG1|nr:annexin ANXC4 [Blumeria hordei DH14]
MLSRTDDYYSGRNRTNSPTSRLRRSRNGSCVPISREGQPTASRRKRELLDNQERDSRVHSLLLTESEPSRLALNTFSTESISGSNASYFAEKEMPRLTSGWEKEPCEPRGARGAEENYSSTTVHEPTSTNKVHFYEAQEPESRRLDENSERAKGANFSIGLGSHSLSGGIHFSRSKAGRRTQHHGSFESRSTKEDHLAYGSYVENHKVISRDPPLERSSISDLPRLEIRQVDEPNTHGNRRHVTSRRIRSPSTSVSNLYIEAPKIHDSTEATGISNRMQALTVSRSPYNEHSPSRSLSNVVGSPLLEPYEGTYQSISPMPSPTLAAKHHHSPSNIGPPTSYSSADEQSSQDSRSSSKKPRRTARFHDPEEEAILLAKALKGERRYPDTAPLISILPGLTHSQTLELRIQYKALVKTAHQKKGVNIAKHIKLRLKDQPDLMKACYVCALGRWESEAFWANCWYQKEKSRRELLIESLMGRTNEEMRAIKKGFRDKKYEHSLVKCMRSELNEDKFKKAIMLALEEKRMKEYSDGKVDSTLVAADVKELRRALKSERGRESAVIEIVVVRSESHLREVLDAYTQTYRSNFAKEILKKSGNIVGELLAHILNGVINAPVRDALLLHHALSLSPSNVMRLDLLISRLVRYHWDRPHFEHVRTEYRYHYAVELQTAVAEGVSGELGAFLEALCVRRVDSGVRLLSE